MKKKVELLSPAGDLKSFMAAIYGGADAIYVGGDKFSARAYANNFNTEQLCEAIETGHLYGIKVYLTLNTLLKNSELKEVYEYIKPLYQKGLDGVIVQDVGVVKELKEHFAGLEIHGSTQMTITSSYGAKLFKDYGLTRIVPARELSLKDIARIKQEVDIELETFIHGAMCYCYSGQCLYSSFLGGRSGNRGRCAGPCRQPYDVFIDEKKYNSKNEEYPISLKDLCTIEILPKLLEVGIDSFKIEGRMKTPEYVYFVTSLYRKYIDQFYEKGKVEIESKDINLLNQLFVRKNIQTGYYEAYHGKEMITFSKGAYENNDHAFQEISELLEKNQKKIKIKGTGSFSLERNGEAIFQLSDENQNIVAVSKPIVQKAKNRSMTKEDIVKQLNKLGNTVFEYESLDVTLDETIFISNKELNDLRREAIEALKDCILSKTFIKKVQTGDEKECKIEKLDIPEWKKGKNFSISLKQQQQLEGFLEFAMSHSFVNIQKVDLSLDLLIALENEKQILDQLFSLCQQHNIAVYISFYTITRQKDFVYIKNSLDKLAEKEILKNIQGFLIPNFELLQFFSEFKDKYSKKYELIGNYSLYQLNNKSTEFFMEQGISSTVLPFEASKHELKEYNGMGQYIVYSYVPMMETANCIYNSFSSCLKTKEHNRLYIKDRLNKKFPVVANCQYCTNTIYNCVPISLHKELDNLGEHENLLLLIRFTVESEMETKNVLNRFLCDKMDLSNEPNMEFTKGHYNKGIL